MKKNFTHIDKNGNIRMFDIGDKEISKRIAKARCRIKMKPSVLKEIAQGTMKKGDVFAAAKIAGILAAKRVDELIPLCHPIPINRMDIFFAPEVDTGILTIDSEVTVHARTGAEMEALQAAAQAALTVYDMCKAVDRGMVIFDLKLVEKSGGKSGLWKRE